MIKAVIFDLDGTLIRTEHLKALSYGRAAVELAPKRVTESAVYEAFKEVVGRPRQVVAKALMHKFNLVEVSSRRMQEFDVQQPWQAFVQVRLKYYEQILADKELLLEHRCPYNVAFLDYAVDQGFQTGLATMSFYKQASQVLHLLKLENKFDFIATRDDVEEGKPDPEIYNLVADELDVANDECLVIEDSLNGVKAALAADMNVIVVTTDLTRKSIHESAVVDKKWIVDDPVNLKSVAKNLLKEKNGQLQQKNVLIYQTKRELVEAAVDRISQLSEKCIRQQGKFRMALAGGSTPRDVYSLLSERNLDWKNIHLFWGDERTVPPDQEESNFRMVKEFLLEQIDIPSENVHRMKGEIDPQKAAAEYEELLVKEFEESLPRFDLILLGIGADGHTASLFPGTDAVGEKWVRAVDVPQLRTWRITLTLTVINNAKEVIFLVSGSSKSEILPKVVSSDEPDESYPASMVYPSNGNLTWMVDSAAANMRGKRQTPHGFIAGVDL